MSAFWGRYILRKTFTSFLLLSVKLIQATMFKSQPSDPILFHVGDTTWPVFRDDFVMQDMSYVWVYPESIFAESAWMEWLCRLRKRDKSHTLEFLEWKSYHVAITVLTPWMISCLVGVLWAPVGGDDQNAFKLVGLIRASSSRPARVRSIYVIFFSILLTTKRVSKVMQTLLIYR